MKKNSSILKKITFFDNFGAKPSFNINGNSDSTSIFGGLTYFIFFLCSLIYVFYHIYEFLTRTNVMLNFSQKILSPSPMLNFSHHNFSFGVKISDDFNYITNEIFEKHFIMEYRLINQDLSGLKNFTILNKRLCNINDFENITSNLVSEYYCAQIENISDFNIKGNFLDPSYKYIEIKISFKNETLLRYSEIKDFLHKSNLKISVIMKESNLNFDKINLPVTYSYSTFASYIELDLYKRIDVKISEIQFFDDQNLFISNQYLTKYFTTSIIRDYSCNRNDKPNLFSVYFVSNRKVYIFSRVYQKLPDLISNLTGILGQIVIVLWFFITPINEKHLTQTIMNKVMKYGILTFDKSRKPGDITNREISRIHDKSISENELSKSNLNISGALIKNRIQKVDKIKLNSCNLFCSKFCCCLTSRQLRKKLSVIDKCEEKISFYLNVLVYIRKMQELDLIKFLLFNSDHFKIFNFLAGPSILMNDNPNNIYKQFRNQQEEIEFNMDNNIFEDISRSYDFLKGRDSNDETTRKLLNLFTDEVEHFKNEDFLDI